MPLPVNVIFCGLPPPLLVNVSTPEKLPIVSGANFTVTWQFPPAATPDVLGGQPLLSKENPVPLTVIAVKVRV